MDNSGEHDKDATTPGHVPSLCSSMKDKQETVYRAGLIAGNTAAGLGLGVAVGIGTVIAASIAEVAVPAFLVLKAFGLTGGAFGFLRGVRKQ